LDEALAVVIEFSQGVFIQADTGLFVVDWRQDEVEESIEGLVFGQGQIDVVGCAEQEEVLIVGTEHAVILDPV
jgi:hypothetical protein